MGGEKKKLEKHAPELLLSITTLYKSQVKQAYSHFSSSVTKAPYNGIPPIHPSSFFHILLYYIAWEMVLNNYQDDSLSGKSLMHDERPERLQSLSSLSVSRAWIKFHRG